MPSAAPYSGYDGAVNDRLDAINHVIMIDCAQMVEPA
jgi:hypothetical protein